MLNTSKGNMYQFVTHTWNTVKGECYHGCSYCYMKRWGKQTFVHFDPNELKTNLGEGRFIFVGSSCDLFASDIPASWINETLSYCNRFNNYYLFQSKNPARMIEFQNVMPEKSVLCTTLETNRYYSKIMNNAPTPADRVKAMVQSIKTNYVTIEPIMDFDLNGFVEMIKSCRPEQVNIGADSGNNNLLEPPREQILKLLDELKQFTVIARKTNLQRLMY